MAVIFDPAEVFRVVTSQSGAFANIRADLRKQARSLLEKGLKAADYTLADLRATSAMLGADQFGLCLDAFSAATARALAKKFDPHHPSCKGQAADIDPGWARQRVRDIAAGAAPEEALVPLDKLLPTPKRTLDHLAGVFRALDLEKFVASLMAMSDAASNSLVKKLDPRNPKVKGKAADIDSEWARARIMELAAGSDGAPLQLDNAAAPSRRRKAEQDPRDWYYGLAKVYAAGREVG